MKYVKGNLLDLAEQGEFDIIIQGCNCFCTMGSGIAKQIKDRYPKAYLVDQMTEKGDLSKLGKFTQAYVGGWSGTPENCIPKINSKPYSFTVINAYTQGAFGTNGVFADYNAIRSVFKQIKMLYDVNPQAPQKIGIPQIGAGLAGGDWGIIEQIIDEIGFSDLTCVIYDGGK